MPLTSSQAPTSVLRVAGVYLAVGVLWILLSDRLLAYMVSDPATISTLQTLKGWVFVAASAALIAWLVRREVRRLARTQSRFEALAGQGIVGTFAIHDGRLIHANHRLAEIFGYNREEILGMNPLTLVVPEDHARVRAPGLNPEAEGLEKADLVHRRLTGVRKDGSTVQVEVHGRLTDWEGTVAMAGVLLDISDHLRLQDRLRHAGRMEALGEVTGAVAHDFNNFLTGILGNLDLVLSDIADDPVAAEESLKMVRDVASRAANLTGQLLSFSRGRTFQHKPIDANAHLTNLAPFLRSICEGNQELTLELQDDLPFILLDPVALDQLVVNLFVNAKQAMVNGGTITVRTRSRASSAGSDVFLEVQDEGVGMESEVLKRVFEPFFTTKERGTGLGLATVRNIMDEARGHLVVDSAPEKGTTVRLLFPEAAHFLSREVTELPAAHGGSSTRTARIVVLDGSPGVGRVMSVALRRVGHQTLEAQAPSDVLTLLAAEGGSVDLVILDAALPEVSNGDLVGAIRRSGEGTLILATTGTRGENNVPAALAGIPVLAKPFSVDQLLDAVAGAMDPGADAGGSRTSVAGSK